MEFYKEAPSLCKKILKVTFIEHFGPQFITGNLKIERIYELELFFEQCIECCIFFEMVLSNIEKSHKQCVLNAFNSFWSSFTWKKKTNSAMRSVLIIFFERCILFGRSNKSYQLLRCLK